MLLLATPAVRGRPVVSVMPVARREGVLVKPLGDELVAVDTRGDVVHALSPAAAAVWQQCDGRKDMDDARLVTGLSFDEFQSALGELSGAGLLVAGRGFDRRTLLKGAATVGAGAIALPTVWTIVAPTAAMADSGGFTPGPLPTLLASMESYVASHYVPATGDYQFYFGAPNAAGATSLAVGTLERFGQPGPGNTASGNYYVNSSHPEITGFAGTAGGNIPLININNSNAQIGDEPAHAVAVHPAGDNSIVISMLLPAAPQPADYTARVTLTVRTLDAAGDGVRVSVFQGGSSGLAPAASTDNPNPVVVANHGAA